MADPQAAVIRQLNNIQSRTGKTITELLAAVRGSGLAKHGERRSWLMERFKLGYGDANTIVRFGSEAEIDAALVGWIKAAYDAAG